MEIKKFIVPITLDNTNENGKKGDRSFRTQDYIYLDEMADIENIDSEERVCYPTDYAIMNGAMMSSVENGMKIKKSCWTWLRFSYAYNYTNNSVLFVDFDGEINDGDVDDNNGSIRPALQLNLPAVISAKSQLSNVLKIGEYKVGKIIYHTIEFGEYPKTYVGDELNKELERELSNGTLSPTGKKYTGYMAHNESPKYNEEYMFKGQKYVRVESLIEDIDSEFLDGTIPRNRTSLWAKVEPITWIIRNWDEMPKEINLKGSGRAKTMDIQTYDAIISGIPFYTNNKDRNRTLWQNSVIRAYLNGYDLYEELKNGNGNINFKANQNFNFKGEGFLNEAFNQKVMIDLSSIQNEQDCSNTDKSQRPLSPAEIARNELIKKALERRKQAQRLSNSDDQNENVM